MITTTEVERLLDNVLSRYGYDFTGYSKASLKRRIDNFFSKGNYTSFLELQSRLMEDTGLFSYFVEEVTVNVTEMFRDPHFFRVIRNDILPVLATYPFIRIWHAGCSTGEEAYSMAILLEEANLLHKSILYATDLNEAVLAKAKTGIFSAATMQVNSENYIKSGGLKDFSTYYRANYNYAKFDDTLSQRMIFSTHNLVADSSFNQFQLILCRNVLIYFERDLQKHVLELFDKSLDSLGYLALGSKESIRFSSIAPFYKQLDNREKIWRKNR